MKKEQTLAQQIPEAVGSMDNIESIIHCMTRVRIKVIDEEKVDYAKLKAIEGVMGVVKDERVQVVVVLAL